MSRADRFDVQLAGCILMGQSDERNAALSDLLLKQQELKASVNVTPYEDPEDRYEAMANDYGEELLEQYTGRIKRIQQLLTGCSAADRQWADGITQNEQRRKQAEEAKRAKEKNQHENQKQRATVEFLKEYIDQVFTFSAESSDTVANIQGRLLWTGFCSMDQSKGDHSRHAEITLTPQNPIIGAVAVPASLQLSAALPASAFPRYLGTSIPVSVPEGHAIVLVHAPKLRRGLEQGKSVQLLDWGRRSLFFLVDKFAVDKSMSNAASALLRNPAGSRGVCLVAVNGSALMIQVRPDDLDVTVSDKWERADSGGLEALPLPMAKTALVAALRSLAEGPVREVDSDQVRCFGWEEGKSRAELPPSHVMQEGSAARAAV